MGYEPSYVWYVASVARDPSERARLFALAASSTKDTSQRLTYIADTARAAYDAAHFEEAIRTATFLAAAADTEIPRNDPDTVSLQKTAKEVQGWAYLRMGDVAKFNEVVSSYATRYKVAKEEFKEPTSPNQDENFLDRRIGTPPVARPNLLDRRIVIPPPMAKIPLR